MTTPVGAAWVDALRADEVAACNPIPFYRLAARPPVLEPGALAELERIGVRLAALVRDRVEGAAADPVAAARTYGLLGEDWAALALSEPNGIDGAVYRGDFVRTADGWKCLEVNAGNGAGGWLIPLLAAAYHQAAAPALALAGLELAAWNTVRLLFEHVTGRAVRRGGVTEVNTAVVIADADRGEFTPAAEKLCAREYALALAAVAPGVPGQCRFCCADELTVRDRRAWLGGRPVRVVIEQGEPGGKSAQDVFRTFKAGGLDLYTGPATRVLIDKRNLAELRRAAEAGSLPPADQALVLRVVPWTRVARPGPTVFEGDEADFETLLVAHRERFVLKPAVSHGGSGVYIGRHVPPAEWGATVVRALADGNWVAQEYAKPVPDRPGGVTETVWSPFVLGGRWAGGFGRVLSADGYRPTEGGGGHAMRESVNGDPGVEVVPIMELWQTQEI